MLKRNISVLFASNILLVCLTALSACSDDIKLPHVFSGNEVPPEVVAEPRVVPVPTGEVDRTTWPLLGNVPYQPKDFTPQKTIDSAKTEMEGDRLDAEQMQHDYQAAPPVTSSLAPSQP